VAEVSPIRRVIGSSPNTSVCKANKRKKIVLLISILLLSFQASPKKTIESKQNYKGVYIESKIKRFRLFKKDPALKPGQKRR